MMSRPTSAMAFLDGRGTPAAADSARNDAAPIFLLLAVLMTVALLLAWRARRYLSRAVRTSGRITQFTDKEYQRQRHDSGSDTETEYYPHVEFFLEDGSRIVFRSGVSHTTQVRQGTTVSVSDDASSPTATAEIAGFPALLRAWTPAALSGVFAVGFFILFSAARAWSGRMTTGWSRRRLAASGAVARFLRPHDSEYAYQGW